MRGCSLIVLAILALVGCGDGGGGGGGSLMSRCENWCDDRNADEDCGADINCPASCNAFVLNASSTGCNAQLGALLTCFENGSDICPAPGQLSCSAENTALVQCQSGDAGP